MNTTFLPVRVDSKHDLIYPVIAQSVQVIKTENLCFEAAARAGYPDGVPVRIQSRTWYGRNLQPYKRYELYVNGIFQRMGSLADCLTRLNKFRDAVRLVNIFQG